MCVCLCEEIENVRFVYDYVELNLGNAYPFQLLSSVSSQPSCYPVMNHVVSQERVAHMPAVN